MIAWLQAFLGFPPPLGIPSIANRLVFNAYLRRFAAAAPGENLKRILNERRIGVNREKNLGHEPIKASSLISGWGPEADSPDD
jgi:hypothetical protein